MSQILFLNKKVLTNKPNRSKETQMRTLTTIIVVASLLFTTVAFARSDTGRARVVQVRVDSNGKGYVQFDRDLNNRPGCTDHKYRRMLAFDTSTPGGKSVLSLALAAKLSGTEVVAHGLGSCNVYSGVMEDWGYGSSI